MKKKFDLIAASKTRKYKIAMFSMLGVGVLAMIIGFAMLGGVTQTVVPNKLDIEISGKKIVAMDYETTISQDEFLYVDTGTGTDALKDPIEFNTSQCEDIIEPIANMYRAGVTTIKLKPDVSTGDSGTLIIECGNQPAVALRIYIRK